jgi:hypothetical protein
MPGTISEIQVARDGGLEYIRQYPSGQAGFGAKTSLIGLQSPQIPVDRLVAYVNDQEGGRWIGSSYLRPLFKHFLRKDRLLRVDGPTSIGASIASVVDRCYRWISRRWVLSARRPSLRGHGNEL